MMEPRSPDQRRHRVLLGVALIPLVWSAVAAAWPAAPQLVTGAETLPSLAFDQYLVNLRDVGLYPVQNGTYRFSNTGTESLKITKLDPSCGCLSPKLEGDKKVYQPGESGYFILGVATANETPGPHTYTVKVHYEDPVPRQTTVRFKLNLPELKVSVDPPELAFFQYNGMPSEATVYVTDFRGNPIVVTGATSTSDVVNVEVQPAETDENGNRRVPVVLHVPGVVPAGRAISTLVIETDDPEFSKLRIPVMIDGPEVVPASATSVTGPPPPRTP